MELFEDRISFFEGFSQENRWTNTAEGSLQRASQTTIYSTRLRTLLTRQKQRFKSFCSCLTKLYVCVCDQ